MKRGIDRLGIAGAAFIDIEKTPEAAIAKNLKLSVNWRRCWQLGIAIALGIGSAISSSASCAFAQITPDTTLGSENSVVTPNTNVRGFPAELIEGGATRGAHLFHSFQDFNVGDGQRVYFANPAAIENILSRVTGNNLSNILGTLGVDGGASLFLLNPNGVIFGENAKLDISGSFVASTANALVFENGTQFSATNPDAPPLLKISITPGLQYGTNQPRAIISNSGNLAVGQNLTLSAGNLDLQGQLAAGEDLTLFATDTVRVRDSVVSPFIASANGNLLVQGNQGVDIFALNHPNSGLFSGGNMVLRSANTVGGDARYWSGGSFRIEKLDGSLGDLYSPYDPIIRSLGNVRFNTYRGTSLHILAGGAVNIGTVIITGAETGAAGVDYIQETVQLSNGTEVSINGRLQPTLDIRAGVNSAFIGVPGVTGVNFPRDIFLGQVSRTNAPTSADITIANALILATNGLVFVTNQYQPNTALPGGDITINSGNIRVNGGSVILDSRGNIAITNSSISSLSGVGNAGDITLLAFRSISLTNSTISSDSLADVGNAGNITVFANEGISLSDNSRIASLSRNAGNSGDINVIALRGISLTDSEISSLAYIGNSGNINVAANEAVSLSNRFIASSTLLSGDGGDINIQAGKLLLTDGAQITVSAFVEGSGGSLIINASESVEVIGINNTDGLFAYPSSLTAQTASAKDGGNIEITTPVLRVTDGAAVNMITFGKGKGGNLIVNASELVEVMGTSADGQFRSTLDAQTFSTGDGGNIEISTPILRISDDALVNVNTRGKGNAGNVIVNAFESVEIIGAGLGAQTTSTSTGNGGNVEITTPVLMVTDGGIVSVSTSGEGKGGNLIVDASKLVQVMGSSVDGQLVSSLIAVTSNQGDGGNVEITTPVLMVTDGGGVSVGTLGGGKGGNLIVDASKLVQVMGTSANSGIPSRLDASTSGTGDGGNVEFTTSRLLVTDSARVSASTTGEGKGGNVIVNALEEVQLSGTGGLFVNATTNSTAGNLTVETGEMSVKDGAQVTVSSRQGQAGNLSITANTLTLNQGTISAETAKSDAAEGGANITLSNLDFLRMDNESLISASALETANGGNVTIDSTLIVATPPTGPEGSDIIANADRGNGGRVNVTTQGLFGIEFRPRRTPKNDITVSSTFGLSGEYVLNTPGVDPSRGLAQLPVNVVDASQQIDRRCTPDAAKERGSFTITGRGGLPPNPNEPLQGDSAIANWITLDSEENNNTPPASTTPNSSAPRELVEAQGWIINEKGQVVLIATAPNVTPQGMWLSPPECNSSKLKLTE
jgi:filamentous hemagglutinin family protein